MENQTKAPLKSEGPFLFRNRILQGDAFTVLKTLPDNLVDCVVTSPPYWGLRDYGTAQWEGGSGECGHIEKLDLKRDCSGGVGPNGRDKGTRGEQPNTSSSKISYRDVCGKCGARRIDSQLGLEKTPQEFISRMVEVFREVRRVLKPEGTAWVNMGDSYAQGKSGSYSKKAGEAGDGVYGRRRRRMNGPEGEEFFEDRNIPPGLKPKDLCGIPWMLAFALRDDGWWLRQDIIWSKPNPMPESVTDRCTKSHEYLFLLTKSARYYWDQEAVRERTGNEMSDQEYTKAINGYPGRSNEMKDFGGGKGKKGFISATPPNGRNIRSVWNIATQPFNSVASYGSYRIASPDCPRHDYQAGLESVLDCDERLHASRIDRNPDNGNYLFPMQEGVVFSIPLDHPSFPFDGTSAIPHSKRNYRTEAELMRDEIFYGIFPFRNEYRKLIGRSFAKCARISGNNIEVDVFRGALRSDLSAQILYRIFCTVTFLEPPSGCLCHYEGRFKKSQDHFAVFPEALVEPCIKAGTSEKGYCPECGRPWVRVVEKEKIIRERLNPSTEPCRERGPSPNEFGGNNSKTISWRPSCTCNQDPIPGLCLDPFSGAGTVAAVAWKLGRDYLGIELNPEYIRMSQKRLAMTPAQIGMFS